MDFVKELAKININPTEEMLNSFELYYNRLVTVNEVMNLTAITERNEVYNKHFYDSLLINSYCNKKVNLCDVGSGAGFPSIPLAIINKDINVTIIDALNKRINFLNDLVLELKLDNVKAYHKRAEDYAKEKREFFDITTARAVARLNVLAELCLPLTKIGGVFIAMKGSDGELELTEAKKAIATLGGELVGVNEVELPDGAGKRDIIIIKKIKATPAKYPRAFAKIKEKPL